MSANAWVEAKVSKLLPRNELQVVYGDRYKPISLADTRTWRPANPTPSGNSTQIEQAVQEAMQMGFEVAAVRAMQEKLQLTSTTALIEALVQDSAAI